MSQAPKTMNHQQALARLREGNQRFVNNVRSVEALVSQHQRASLVGGQTPFAVVLSCSDSRVPSELVFDCGLGDLFVVRVAGNVVAPSIVGSVEFATATFGTELVVVMGHTRCGAVSATVDALTKGTKALSANVGDIIERISPAVTDVVQSAPSREEMLKRATIANVRAAVNHLRHGSRVLEERIQQGKLAVVAAQYALETGEVDFFDDALA